jgi:hypothetical protein
MSEIKLWGNRVLECDRYQWIVREKNSKHDKQTYYPNLVVALEHLRDDWLKESGAEDIEELLAAMKGFHSFVKEDLLPLLTELNNARKEGVL